MLKVVCVGGKPCQNVINKCLISFVRQSVTDWEMVVVLDPGEYEIYVKDARISIHFNDKSEYALLNSLKAIKLLDPEDEDILIFMDADDWLTDDYKSLAEIEKTYKNFPKTLVTHGSWKPFPPFMHKRPTPVNNPYSRGEFNNIRGAQWKGSQLRTMKYKLFKLIKESSLRKANGEYFVSGHDMVYMFPALEMAGFDRSKFISKPIYVYNKSGVCTRHTHKLECQQEFRYLKGRQPYKMLPINF